MKCINVNLVLEIMLDSVNKTRLINEIIIFIMNNFKEDIIIDWCKKLRYCKYK